MQSIYFKIPGVLLIAVLLASCSGLKDINITSVENFKLIELRENMVTFSADVGVSNPSAIGFRVREIDVATTADGIYIGNLQNTESLKIPAQSDSVYSMVLNMRLSNVLSTANQMINLSRKSQVNIELKGFIKSTSGLLTRKTNIQESRMVDVPRTIFF